MHVFPKDAHPLCLSLGLMGDISVHASVAAHDTTLDNSNHHDTRYVPRNIISIAACNTTLKMIILIPQSCLRYNAIDMLK